MMSSIKHYFISRGQSAILARAQDGRPAAPPLGDSAQRPSPARPSLQFQLQQVQN